MKGSKRGGATEGVKVILQDSMSSPKPDNQASIPPSQQQAHASSPPMSPGDTAEQARQRARREEFLQKRKARGSIFYDGKTAQIPLYAAPEGANLADAPALSSFAPIAPLGIKRSTPAQLTVLTEPVFEDRPDAKAIATMDHDGKIVTIRRNKSGLVWNKSQRFSLYITHSETQENLKLADLPPLPPLPSLNYLPSTLGDFEPSASESFGLAHTSATAVMPQSVADKHHVKPPVQRAMQDARPADGRSDRGEDSDSNMQAYASDSFDSFQMRF